MNFLHFKKIIAGIGMLVILSGCGGSVSTDSTSGTGNSGSGGTASTISYTTISAFPLLNGGNNSPSPATMLQGSDGNFYYATQSIYKMTPTGSISVIGTIPNSSINTLIQGSDGNFYGIAYVSLPNASPYAQWVIFKVTPAGTMTTLLTSPLVNQPITVIQGQDGNLYGIVAGSTGTDFGYVFQLTTTGVLTRIYTPASAGQVLTTLVQGSDGNLYGTTNYQSGYPSFLNKLTTSGVLTQLGSTALPDVPDLLIQGTDGNFYAATGTTTTSASVLNGIVFQITPSGNSTILSTLPGQGLNTGSAGVANYTGVAALHILQAADGTLYGTTKYGGTYGAGTLFSLTPSGTYTKLYDYGSGAYYATNLIMGSNGKLYGSTVSDSTNPSGSFFSVGL